jgi:hypothetical protein
VSATDPNAVDGLIAAAAAVDVIDAAGEIIGNPRRYAPSAPAGMVLALACATERLWAIALEAEILARALVAGGFNDAETRRVVTEQVAVLLNMLAEIRGEGVV